MHESAPTETARTGGDDTGDLTRRLAAGDEEAFREFHERYFDRLFPFLLSVCRGDEHAAREAMQDALLRVVRYVRPFADEETFWGWLKAVGRSAARDRGRKHRRYFFMLRDFASCGEDAHDTGEEERLAACLEESLDELDPDDRHLLEEKYLEAVPLRALAAEVGRSEKAVESRLLRLRRALRERVLSKLRTS